MQDCNISMGLMCRPSIYDEYRGIRKGGGTRLAKIGLELTYTQIIEKGLNRFFPGKKSGIGKLASYEVDGLGSYTTIIPEEGFDLKELIAANGGPSKTKLYVYVTAKTVNHYW